MRTFIAIDSGPAVQNRAVNLIERLRRADAHVKWVEPDQLHWTLCFLGEVDPREIDAVCRAVGSAAAPVAPFSFTAEGAGAFPDVRRPRTLWLGVRPPTDEPLIELQAAVEAAMTSLGYPKENRRFHPHLTLGRVRRGGRLDALVDLLARDAQYEAGTVDVTEVHVYSSRLGRSGPAHDLLARCELQG